MRLFAIVLVLLTLVPAVAAADVEVTLMAGQRSGEAHYSIEADGEGVLILCVTVPCLLAEARTEESEAFSLIVDVPISNRWMVEGLLTRQEGDLELSSPFPPEFLSAETFDLTTAQIGLLRQWREERLRPFVAGGVGVTRFETSAGVYDQPPAPGVPSRSGDTDGLSASLAGGLKASLSERLALRLEGRYFWHDLDDRLGGALEQTEISLGLTARF